MCSNGESRHQLWNLQWRFLREMQTRLFPEIFPRRTMRFWSLRRLSLWVPVEFLESIYFRRRFRYIYFFLVFFFIVCENIYKLFLWFLSVDVCNRCSVGINNCLRCRNSECIECLNSYLLSNTCVLCNEPDRYNDVMNCVLCKDAYPNSEACSRFSISKCNPLYFKRLGSGVDASNYKSCVKCEQGEELPSGACDGSGNL
jgi:hypothetical protein